MFNAGMYMIEKRLCSIALIASAIVLVGLTGCNRGSDASASGGDHPVSGAADRSQVAEGPRSGGEAADRSGYGGARSYGRDRDEAADREPVPMFHGEPMWSENRSHTAKENAEYHFERAGNDLESKTLDDFLTKVHRFGDQPPAGTLKLVRANGDRLLYDPKSDLFGVFTRDGAPRTIFKPSDGMAYWNEQKAREEAQSAGGGDDDRGYRRRSFRSRDDGGGGERPYSGAGRYDGTRSGDDRGDR